MLEGVSKGFNRHGQFVVKKRAQIMTHFDGAKRLSLKKKHIRSSADVKKRSV